jgi:hypothetical protein
MAFGKTYLVGSDGLFRVYDHNTDTWNDYSGISSLDLFDVKTSQLPNFPDYAIICGDNYVGYTTNAGQTVTQVNVTATGIAKAFQISIPESIAMQNPGIYIVGSAITGTIPRVIKSVDAGLTYTSVITGLNSTFGLARSIYFTDVDTGIIGHGGGIAKTINGGTSWSYLNGGVVLAAGEIVSGLCMSNDQQTIIAATDKKIYKSTNGGTSFSVVYTWNALDQGVAPKYTCLSVYNPDPYAGFTNTSGLWISATSGPIAYSSDMGATWSEVFPPGIVGGDATYIFASSFYLPTEGFFTYDLPADSLGVVYKATDANTTMVTASSTDYYGTGSMGYSLWSTQVTPGCGCPPGFILDPVAQTCRQSYFTCPDGFTWNPATEECEGAETPCLLDLVFAIDRSSSISATEMDDYRTFIQAIIDAVQDTAGGNARITDGTVRVGIVFWGNESPITFGTNQGNLSLQVGPVSTVSNSVWGPGIGVGTLKAKIDSMQVPPTNNGQGTNYFAGLAAAYGTLIGTNSRPSAKKRILWFTDGWPNTSNPPLTLNGYTQPTNYLDNACSGAVPANGTPGSSNLNAPLNCCHGATDVIAVNPINTSPYTIAKRLMYTQAMSLAQDIKNGNIGGIGASPIMPITAIIVGTDLANGQSDKITTRGALVGPVNPTTGVPLTGPGNYCSFDVNAFVNPGVTASTSPVVSFPYWNASYQVDSPPGSGNWLRFPSNNVAGTADYFITEFNFDPAIIEGIKTSLLCTITEPPMICPEPCVLNTTTGVCDCVSSDLFVPCCYTLTNCNTGLVEYTVNTFGLSNDYLNSLQGQILKITGLDECLYVNITFECTNSTEISIDAVEEAFETCEDCKEYIASPPCYLLTNCNNTDIILRTTQNLSIFSGKVVELNDYPGLCWTVLKTSNCPGPFTTVGVVESYDDCECCFQYQCK